MLAFLNGIRERLKDVALGADDPTAWRALAKPIAPFDGQGSALVAFSSMMVLVGSIAAAVFSIAGLIVALSVIYLICAKVFGLEIDIREPAAYGL